jgi:hypothetical protein
MSISQDRALNDLPPHVTSLLWARRTENDRSKLCLWHEIEWPVPAHRHPCGPPGSKKASSRVIRSGGKFSKRRVAFRFSYHILCLKEAPKRSVLFTMASRSRWSDPPKTVEPRGLCVEAPVE